MKLVLNQKGGKSRIRQTQSTGILQTPAARPVCRSNSFQLLELHADIMHVVISHTDICDDSVTREHGYNVNKLRTGLILDIWGLKIMIVSNLMIVFDIFRVPWKGLQRTFG